MGIQNKENIDVIEQETKFDEHLLRHWANGSYRSRNVEISTGILFKKTNFHIPINMYFTFVAHNSSYANLIALKIPIM
jgi:hypothetical protein